MTLADSLGIVGAISLGLCGVPQAIACCRGRTATGLSGWFLAAWFGGEVAMLGHILLINASAALLANYIANVAITGVLVYWKLRDLWRGPPGPCEGLRMLELSERERRLP